MMLVFHLLTMFAALVIVAEAFNKLERTDLFDGRPGLASRLRGLAWLLRPWRWTRPKLVLGLKLLAWSCMAIGSAGVLVTPLMANLPPISSREAALVVGFAILIVRSRLKEG